MADRLEQRQRELQRTTQRLATLRSIDKTILAARSIEDTFRVALAGLCDLGSYRGASVVLIDEGSGEVVLAATDASDGAEMRPGSRFPVEDLGAGLEAVRGGEPYLVDDLSVVPDLPPVLRRLAGTGSRSFVAFPMLFEGRVIGALSLASGDPGAFGPEDVEVGVEVAGQLAIAVIQERLRSAQERHRGELERLVEHLQRTDAQRRRLLSRLVTAQEAERSRIAADLHDDPVQAMTAVGIRLEILKGRIHDPALIESVDTLQEAVGGAVGRLRQLLVELRPPILEGAGLVPTLRASLDAAVEDFVDAYELLDEVSTEPSVETQVIAYRIAQEALANIRKHARANEVRVELESRDHGLRVCIEDDGVGFASAEAPESRPGHLGLTIMRERAELAGGWLQVRSSPGAGTSVEFWLPPEGATESLSEG